MLRISRIYVFFLLVAVAFAAVAGDGNSFSKQMNQIKRSKQYVYAESSAPSEEDAKAACEALLKIEITKYIAAANSKSNEESRIVKDISEYKRDFLTQQKGDMVRVFGYVSKSSIDGKESEQADCNANTPDETATNTAVAEEQPISTSSARPIQTGDISLARWQADLLQSVVDKPNMTEAKKLLNRYKTQNRIKRLGDSGTANMRPSDTYYLVFDTNGVACMLLAPSEGNSRYDMLSGSIVDFFANTKGAQYIWFQISK